MRRLVASTRKMMSAYPADPDAPIERGLHVNLRALADALLPAEVLDPNAASPTALFFVTTDDFLGTIPFEAFDIGEGDAYEPLLAHRDVAYARHDRRDRPESAEGPGIILVHSEHEDSTARRDPAHPLPELREAEEEAGTLARLDNSATLLTGESASRSELRALWENAPYIYIASHTANVTPYIAAIVLADPRANVIPAAAMLRVFHVREADLSRCRVVVLSGCSSGSPYLAGGGAAPTLADAFLDAGAEAVVHTFWEVKDEDARRTGTGFMTRWTEANTSAVHALAERRRGELRGPRGIRHPSSWASYAITVSRL
jgi:hypothetical protein